MAKVETNSLVLLLGVILFSFSVVLLSPIERIVVLLLSLIIPFFFGINTLSFLLKMKGVILTSLLILVFGFIEKKEISETLSSFSLFLSLVIVSFLYILNTDLLLLSSYLGALLYPLFKKRAWRISSSIASTLFLLPLVLTQSSKMLEARKNRGGSFLSHPIKNLIEYTVSLMLLLIKKLDDFQTSLFVRSFSFREGRTTYPLKKRDYFLLSFFILSFISIVLWKNLN